MNFSFSVRLAVLLLSSLTINIGGRRHDADTIEAVRSIVERLNEDSEEDSCNRTLRMIINDYVLPVSWKVDDYRIVTVELCTDPNCPSPVNDICIVCSACLEKLSTYYRIKSEEDLQCSSNDILDGSTLSSGNFNSIVSDTILLNLFDEFARTYNRTYADRTETERRFELFKGHLKRVERARKFETGSAIHGITFFADMTDEEIAEFTGYFVPSLSTNTTTSFPTVDAEMIPNSYDWREKGAVTTVRSQKRRKCKACWAFAAMAVLESQYYLMRNKLIWFSPQQLIDCDNTSKGCEGGRVNTAFEYLRDGIETENNYPYKAENGTCKYSRNMSIAAVSDIENLEGKSETLLAEYVYKKGPIAVSINADLMKTYINGVSHPVNGSCDPMWRTHAVVIVGFAVEKNTSLPYWIIKNSWGEKWGDKGYYYLYRGIGACGVNKEPYIGFLNKSTTMV